MINNGKFILPEIAKCFNELICGFTMPVLGNQALTRESITSGLTTEQNRINLANLLNIDYKRMFSPHQIHSDTIIDVTTDKIGHGATSLINAIDGDACMTDLKNVLLIITWADCIPVLIYDYENKRCAAIHSGWKGAQKNIVGKTIIEFKNRGADLGKLYAVIGPGIKHCCYNVGEEFKEYFKYLDFNKYFSYNGNELFFNLSKLVFDQLIESGLNSKNIEYFNICTACNSNPKFFSCRKDGKNKFEGQAAFIGIFY
jgi:hypothetical protein